MSDFLGYVPVYGDARTGEVYTDESDVGALVSSPDQSGAFRPFGFLQRPERRFDRMKADAEKYTRKMDKFAYRHGLGAYAASPDAHNIAGPGATLDTARRAGVVNQNSWNGLGNVTLAISGTGNLTATVNRIGWVKGLILNSDSAINVMVTALTIAGIPVQIGSTGAPLSLFASDSTRWSQSFSDRLVAFGQQIRVDLQNLDAGATHVVVGAISMDECNPDAFARLMENLILGSLAG